MLKIKQNPNEPSPKVGKISQEHKYINKYWIINVDHLHPGILTFLTQGFKLLH